MKKRSKLCSNLMLIPPMVLLALVWSPGSSAFDITSHLPDFLTKRTLAVDTENQSKEITKPEDIVVEDTVEEVQKSIEEAASEVVEQTEGSLPLDIKEKHELEKQIALEFKTEEEKEIPAEEKEEIALATKTKEKEEHVSKISIKSEHIKKKKKNKKKKDQITCEKEEKKKTLTEEVAEQERDIMAQYQDFFKAVMVPMMANYISSQSFKAPQLQMGFAGIPAQNTNYGAGLGLNLLSLSDYYNSRSLGFGGNTTINNYNVTGDYYNGAYNNSIPQNQFNPMMSEQTFSSATASPYGFNFGNMAIQDHSRFDQMNAQNVQIPSAPAVESAPVITPMVTGPAPAATLRNANVPVSMPNLRTTNNVVSE